MKITRRSLLAASAASATLAMPAIARAEATSIEFYFPVAVGGPITKVIDAEKSGRHLVIFNIEITDKGRAERDRLRLIAPVRTGNWW